MTVTAQTPYSPYTAAPGATVFATGFRVIIASDLIVKVDNVVVTSGFTLSGLDVASSVDVTFSTPMTGGELVELRRQVPLTRATDYQIEGEFPALVVNKDFDRLWQALQDTAFSEYGFPTPQADYLLGWNPSGTALTNINPATLGGGGGGGGTLGGVTVPNFTLDQATPNARHEILTTNPVGWNALSSRKTVDCEFICNNYFLNNPGGHVALVTRCNMDLIATQVSGQGAIFGDLTWSGFDGDQALFKPASIIETWDPAMSVGQRYLFPNTTGPRGLPLQDGQRYRWIVESTLSQDGRKFIRYRIYKYAGATKKGWDLLVDTGDVLDHNAGADLAQHGLVFGHVLGENLGAWSIDFSNIKVTWGPPGNIVSDNATQLSKFGADLSGDLNFVGNARRIQAPFNAGPALTNSLTFQSADVNTATTLVAKPNGTSTTANFLFSNNSSSASTYGAVTFGMSGAVGLIESFGYSASNPEIGVNVGAGTRIATFKATGIQVLNAATLVGPVSASMTGMNSIGGSNATSFAASAFNFDTTCADGTIRTYMSATPTNVQIEQVVRPLYCFLSCLLAELRNRKVI